MATIKVKRATNFFNRTRNYQIYIDGQLANTSYINGIESIEADAGSHTLIAKSLWVRSQELSFEIKENETKTFEVSIFKLMKFFYLIIVFLILLPFVQSGAFMKYAGFIPIPAFSVLLYYMTFGRKEYFILKEVHWQ
jgi:hypothetical protein